MNARALVLFTRHLSETANANMCAISDQNRTGEGRRSGDIEVSFGSEGTFVVLPSHRGSRSRDCGAADLS